jgi:hypothetical protein
LAEIATPRQQFDFPPVPIFNAPAKLHGLVGPVSRELRLTMCASLMASWTSGHKEGRRMTHALEFLALLVVLVAVIKTK